MVPSSVLCTASWSWACPIAVCPWRPWSSSSSMCLQDLHVISLILLLRIRLTRRGGVCWSEPRGVPRPSYNDGGCASPSLEASQDWHKALESMPDEKNDPEGVNPGPEEVNPAWEVESRPGPGESRSGPAGIEESRPSQGSAGLQIAAQAVAGGGLERRCRDGPARLREMPAHPGGAA
jgi:hypothetical protein